MSKDWRKYTDSDSYDSKIPKWPDGVYNNKGWISWADFLGNDKLATQKRQYPDLVELRNIARLRNITSQKNWISFVKQKSNNSNLPIELSKVYKNKGWKGWADFLGKEDKE
jgi:hypothetical protein